MLRTADIGYQYCIEAMKPKLTKENPEYDDTMRLWIMVLNGYAYFMHNTGRVDEAFKLFSQAYDASVEIGAENDEQIVLLLNNLGTVSKLRGDNESAFSYFHRAETLGKNFPDIDNFSYVYLNLGYLYMESKLLTEAKEYCNRALNNASRHQYEEGKIEAEECLTRVKEVMQE